MAEPYYEDELVALYLGGNTEHTDWTACDCMITDPPYGRKWRQGRHRARDGGYKASSAWSAGIIGDESTEARDRVLDLWGPDKPAILFGDLMLAPPPRRQTGLRLRKTQRRRRPRGDRRSTPRLRSDLHVR